MAANREHLDPPDVREIIDELVELRAEMLQAEHARADAIAKVHPRHRRSAANLVHYLALRGHDVRELQDALTALGLSSLGRAEAHVLATVEAVLSTLAKLAGVELALPPTNAVGIAEGSRLLVANADALLGPARPERATRIMVTMPTEAANDPQLVARMAAAGMDVARVNCAHDHPDGWARMAANARAAAPERPVKVFMDLGGPKLRTSALPPGPKVLRVRPRRDLLGRAVEPGRAVVTAAEAVPPTRPGDVTVPVIDARWVAARRAGERIEVIDTRGAHRHMDVAAVDGVGLHVEVWDTTYLATGTELRVEADEGTDTTTVGELPAVEQALVLEMGDTLTVVEDAAAAADHEPGDEAGRIGCTLPEAFSSVRAGERILFDDGKIEGVIAAVGAGVLEVEITRARRGGARLRGGKGINLPDSDLAINAITEADVASLAVAARLADGVNASFVRHPDDVAELQRHLRAVNADHLGVVLKIETVPAFEHLPELLLSALASERVGVMIARGDLAVEAGYERLAEVQEEILWLCEAAHVPVIWATQVLDSLARTGVPSRAEVTDAAMGQRAECVMLNKGPEIDVAIDVLANILHRMADHQRKKQARLRRLRAWDRAKGSLAQR